MECSAVLWEFWGQFVSDWRKDYETREKMGQSDNGGADAFDAANCSTGKKHKCNKKKCPQMPKSKD